MKLLIKALKSAERVVWTNRDADTWIGTGHFMISVRPALAVKILKAMPPAFVDATRAADRGCTVMYSLPTGVTRTLDHDLTQTVAPTEPGEPVTLTGLLFPCDGYNVELATAGDTLTAYNRAYLDILKECGILGDLRGGDKLGVWSDGECIALIMSVRIEKSGDRIRAAAMAILSTTEAN